jgi:hypothetical protein
MWLFFGLIVLILILSNFLLKVKIMNESTKQHSKLGIASCVIALMTFLIFLLAVAMFFLYPQSLNYLTLRGYLILLLVPIPTSVVGVILGVIPLFFPNRTKQFQIIGIALNLIFGVIVAIVAILFIIAVGLSA